MDIPNPDEFRAPNLNGTTPTRNHNEPLEENPTIRALTDSTNKALEAVAELAGSTKETNKSVEETNKSVRRLKKSVKKGFAQISMLAKSQADTETEVRKQGQRILNVEQDNVDLHDGLTTVANCVLTLGRGDAISPQVLSSLARTAGEEDLSDGVEDLSELDYSFSSNDEASFEDDTSDGSADDVGGDSSTDDDVDAADGVDSSERSAPVLESISSDDESIVDDDGNEDSTDDDDGAGDPFDDDAADDDDSAEDAGGALADDDERVEPIDVQHHINKKRSAADLAVDDGTDCVEPPRKKSRLGNGKRSLYHKQETAYFVSFLDHLDECDAEVDQSQQ